MQKTSIVSEGRSGTHYVIYMHGVNVRNKKFSEILQKAIEGQLQAEAQRLKSEQFLNRAPIPIEPVAIYWGDVNDEPGRMQLERLEHSPAWKMLWMKKIRLDRIFRFATDAVMYLSPWGGERVVDYIYESLTSQMSKYDPKSDFLHVVAHSWGTVILFDVLFGTRWNELNLPGASIVNKIRQHLSISADDSANIPISSIHTMGSPLALFELLYGKSKEEADKVLAGPRNQTASPIMWRNYLHPGDLVAYPIQEAVLPGLEKGSRFDVKDRVINPLGIPFNLALLIATFAIAYLISPLKGIDFVAVVVPCVLIASWLSAPIVKLVQAIMTVLFNIPFVSLLGVGWHHGSYMQREEFAQELSQAIVQCEYSRFPNFYKSPFRSS